MGSVVRRNTEEVVKIGKDKQIYRRQVPQLSS